MRSGSVKIGINVPDTAAAVQAATARWAAGAGFALATLNLDHLVKLRRDPAFARAYAAQDLVCADGNPIVWLSRLAGQPVALVPGADLIAPMVTAASRAGVPLVLIGGTPDSLAAAGQALQSQAPGLRIALQVSPPMGFDPAGAAADEILGQVARAGPCLCLIALGAPKQEILAARGREIAPQAGFLSIGAGLDFLAGAQRRAPAWVRMIAMEWLWRMLTNPRRLFVRYLRCALILPGLTVQALRLR